MYIYIYCKYVHVHISLARQAAVPPRRNYTEFLSVISQSTTEHLAEKPSKSSPNRSKDGDNIYVYIYIYIYMITKF